jgi:hypothetical protein
MIVFSGSTNLAFRSWWGDTQRGDIITLVLLSLFKNEESRLMRSPCCLCVVSPCVIARQWVAKHISMAANAHVTIELLDVVVCMWSCIRYSESSERKVGNSSQGGFYVLCPCSEVAPCKMCKALFSCWILCVKQKEVQNAKVVINMTHVFVNLIVT